MKAVKSLRNSSSHLKQGFLLRFVDFSKRSNLYSFSKPEIFYQKSLLSPISFNARLNYSCCLLFLFILKTLASVKISDQFALLFKFLLRKRPNFYSQKQSQPKKNSKAFSVPKKTVYSLLCRAINYSKKNEWDISKIICKSMWVKTTRNSSKQCFSRCLQSWTCLGACQLL